MAGQILLFGAAGQVGQEWVQTLPTLGTVVCLDRQQVDLTRVDEIEQAITTFQPDIIINAAAYTAVDKAEQEPDLAHQINAIAPIAMAQAAQKLGALLVHLSTDYVFDGQQSHPYKEDDPPAPLGVYGRTKLAGEEGIQQGCDRYIILRTAWVYGTHGKGNFVKTMLRLAAQREELRVVDDQVGSPTWAYDIAQAGTVLVEQATQNPSTFEPGIYHFTNSGVASWYDFAVAILEEARQLNFPIQAQRVVPISTVEYPTPAKRPAFSVLCHRKIQSVLGTHPSHWQHSLRAMLLQYRQ